jgi:CHAT domain-containing protein
VVANQGGYDVLSDDAVSDLRLVGAPFVFLNACQVGAGQQVLGDYSGMAAALLRAGACAVVAPLWSVPDDRASELALEFYERVLHSPDGVSPAEAMRLQCATFNGRRRSAACLAYQFFGHAGIRLRLAERHVAA